MLRVRIVNDGPSQKADGQDGEEEEDYIFLKKIETAMLSEMTLRGVEGIRRVFMREPKLDGIDPVTGAAIRYHEWLLDTEGVNLHAVMCADRRVDDTRTTSNDIVEIIRVLGVEAVRQVPLPPPPPPPLPPTLQALWSGLLAFGYGRPEALKEKVAALGCREPYP